MRPTVYVYMVIFAWRCIIINKTRRNPVLFLSKKIVFTKLTGKNANFKLLFGDFCDFWVLILPCPGQLEPYIWLFLLGDASQSIKQGEIRFYSRVIRQYSPNYRKNANFKPFFKRLL